MIINGFSKNIFEYKGKATIVIPVNCMGVMGAGLAKQFKDRYPKAAATYRKRCVSNRKTNHIDPFYVNCGNTKDGETVWALMFPTKYNFWEDSDLKLIESGLEYFVGMNDKHDSYAWPKIGCGLGKLDWATEVYPLLHKYLVDSKENHYFIGD